MPQNWKTYKLGEFAEVQNGYAFKSKDLTASGIPVIKIKNIVSPNVVLEGAGYYSGAIDDKLEKYIIKRNDFLISMTGSTVNVMSSAVGKMGKYRLDDISLLNQRVGKIYITKKEIADFDYLCHFLNRFEINYNLALNATGSANQANISPTQIKDLEVLLPPLPEQIAIAQILSAIDDKIENNLAINKTLEEMAMALYKHWFMDFGPFQEEQLYNAEIFGINELISIPESFEILSIKNIIKRLKQNKKYNQKNILPKGNVKVFDQSSAKVLGFHNNEPDFKANANSPILIFGDHTCILELVCQDFSVGPNVIPFILRNKENTYVTYLGMKNRVGMNDYKRHWSEFNLHQLIFPKQEKILQDFNSKIRENFSAILSNEIENQTLTQLRDTLLPKLISGEVRLKEFQEQTASVL